MTDFDRPTAEPTSGTTSEPPPVAASDIGAANHETTAVPVPTQPIAGPPSSASAKPSRARWFAAAGLIALVIGATTLITLSLTAGSSTSTVLRYAPADSTMYGEFRLDLPGDQRQKVGQFLSKFPGFADQAALDTKLDEVLDRLTSESTSGKETYTTDIKPWFDGQLGFSVGPIPEVNGNDSTAAAKAFRAVALIAIKDEVKARSWFENAFKEAGVAGTSETYQGVQLTTFTDPKDADVKGAFGIVAGKIAIVGDARSVKAAVDTNGSSGLAKASGFAAADAALNGDDIGFFYFDMKSWLAASRRLSATFASTPPVSDALLAMVPDWMAMRVRLEGDALVLDTAQEHVSTAPAVPNRANGVPAYAPPSTVALMAGNDLGTSLKQLIKIYREEPSTAEALKQLDQTAGLIGGLDAAVQWMGDTGAVISKNGDGIEGGVISVPADAAAAKQLLTQLRSLVQLGGAQMGVTTRDETYKGQTITVLDLGSLKGLAGMAGAFGGGLPDGADATKDLPDGNAEVAYVATDQVVAIGSSPEFVKHVLDAGAGASLADDARFQGLVGRVEANHAGLNFVDIAAVRALIEGSMASAPASERDEYEKSIKPFLTPFDAYIASGVVGGSVDQGHAIITVK
jgi:hypothetical protein